MRRLVGVVIIASLFACKKHEASSRSSQTPTPGPSRSTAEVDALWALAPEGAQIGVVISPAGLARLEAASAALKKAAATVPQAAEGLAKLEATLDEAIGTKELSLAAAGLSAQKGGAFFVGPTKQAVMIVPVVDRAKWVAAMKGETKGDLDVFDAVTCKTVKNVYACAQDVALLDKLGTTNLVQHLAIAGARGDVEVAGAMAEGGKQIVFASAIQLERGAIAVRGALKGLPGELTSRVPGPVKPRIEGDSTVGFAVMNVAPLLKGVPAFPLAPGVTSDALAASVNGPVTMTIAAGAMMADVRVPLSDATHAQKLVEQCDSIPQLAQLGAKVQNGVCSVPFPQMQVDIDAWVENNELRIGTKKATPSTVRVPMSALGTEIAHGEWAFALAGRGTLLALPQLPPIPIGSLPEEAMLAIRALVMLNELNVAMRVDEDTLRIQLSVRTGWANPDEVVAKLLAVTGEDVLRGTASATAKSIADAAPQSPFAADYKAGVGGVLAVAAGAGMLAAVAIPAFTKYMKKSKRSEAELQLAKLARNLEVYYAANNAFPKGTVGPTPATSCCDGARQKCHEPAAWQTPVWSELDFVVDDPHLFRYAYESDGKRATIRAIGDLDCDGTESTDTLIVTGDDQGNVKVVVERAAPGSD